MAGPTRAVVGAGAWGTTLALLLSRTGPVTLLARDEAHAARLREDGENRHYLPGVPLSKEVAVTADVGDIVDASDLVVLAVPSRAMRATVGPLAASVSPDAVLLSVAKGIESRVAPAHDRGHRCRGSGRQPAVSRRCRGPTWPSRSRADCQPVPWSPPRTTRSAGG